MWYREASAPTSLDQLTLEDAIGTVPSGVQIADSCGVDGAPVGALP